MKPFLFRVAEAYYSEYKSKTSNFTFVFPNQRAGVFFQKYLSDVAQKPLFAPEIKTIGECFQSATDLQIIDNLSCLFRLYRIYNQHKGNAESFDTFVFWGEMLLSDFNELDRFLVDAKQLFSNINDLKEIDTVFDSFTEEQIEIIRQFWANFVPITKGKTEADFVSTWRILLPIYKQFREELLAENLATEGMIARNVVHQLETSDIAAWRNKQFVFVGFNALNKSEKTLFKELNKRGQADFYFDYEADELNDKENLASRFFKENIKNFPSKFKIEPAFVALADRNIELIAVPSSVGQTKQIYSILNNLYPSNDANDNGIKTAIVLPDENLLVPMMHAFPTQIEQINVTMGFPLKATPVFALFEHIFELHKRARSTKDGALFYHYNVMNILNHQYVARLFPNDASKIEKRILTENLIYVESEICRINQLFKTIFQASIVPQNFIAYLIEIIRQIQEFKNDNSIDSLEKDYLYQYYITLNRIGDILKTNLSDIELTLDALIKLIRQLTQNISIPFEGEPLAGLQVMGALETRGLDFENVIVSSFNEGIFPKRSATNSFIPHNLRKCFGLPIADLQDAVISYNFYRLISRAKRIYFLYDSRSEGMQTGEVSRFAYQLRYHYNKPMIEKNISYDVSTTDTTPLFVQKTDAVMRKLETFSSSEAPSNAFSATSINNYLDCPLRFYFSQVEKISEIDEVKELIQEDMFGTIFHSTMENIYMPFVGKIVGEADLDKIINNKSKIDKAINLSFSKNYFKRKDEKEIRIEGNNILIANIIRKYILQLLHVDKKHAPFKYIASEERCNIQFPIEGGQRLVNLKGFIDRIDEKNDIVRILDYKTGGGERKFNDIAQLFETSVKKRPKYALQTFFYGVLYKKEVTQNQTILPGIIFIQKSFGNKMEVELEHNKVGLVQSFFDYQNDFEAELSKCLEDIFNPNIPFTQTEEVEHCKYCPYLPICNR